jgi:hypothetical protein
MTVWTGAVWVWMVSVLRSQERHLERQESQGNWELVGLGTYQSLTQGNER